MKTDTFVYHNKTALIRALINKNDRVLDIGFWGQGVNPSHPNWVHNILKSSAKDVYGVDLEYDEVQMQPNDHYQKASAESFHFDTAFDVIFAGDLIEHLTNPGLFLDCAKKHLAPGGRIIVSTPNTFNLFNMTEKLSKGEPTVNPDHTFYFNIKTLRKLFQKMGWTVDSYGYVYSLDLAHKESWKKKILNVLYATLARVTNSYLETLVVVARPGSR
jgi:2-polyprenyl-3-methyl-5-hydroxy-6-metoxy-1,4-benzoquinol methylase